MIYRSKKDLGMVSLVTAVILLPSILGVYHLVVGGEKTEVGWYLLLVGALSLAVVLFVSYPLDYEITSSTLVIRSGFMRKEIQLSSIEGIYPTRNPLAAPTWSLDRLHIDYSLNGAKYYELISPKNRTEFMREIVACWGGLELKGERVVKRR